MPSNHWGWKYQGVIPHRSAATTCFALAIKVPVCLQWLLLWHGSPWAAENWRKGRGMSLASYFFPFCCCLGYYIMRRKEAPVTSTSCPSLILRVPEAALRAAVDVIMNNKFCTCIRISGLSMQSLSYISSDTYTCSPISLCTQLHTYVSLQQQKNVEEQHGSFIVHSGQMHLL